MHAPSKDLLHGRVSKIFHETWAMPVVYIAKPKPSIFASAPGVQVALARHRRGVREPTSHLYAALSGECFHLAWIRESVGSAMPKPTKATSPPRQHRTEGRKHSSMLPPATNLLYWKAQQALDQLRTLHHAAYVVLDGTHLVHDRHGVTKCLEGAVETAAANARRHSVIVVDTYCTYKLLLLRTVVQGRATYTS